MKFQNYQRIIESGLTMHIPNQCNSPQKQNDQATIIMLPFSAKLSLTP